MNERKEIKKISGNEKKDKNVEKERKRTRKNR